jgi:hypothetical protein
MSIAIGIFTGKLVYPNPFAEPGNLAGIRKLVHEFFVELYS